MADNTPQPTTPVSANDKIVVGIIGCGGMGMSNLGDFKRNPDVEIAAVCDVYQPHLDRAVKAAGGKVEAYKDFRKLLERKDLNAVVVSTPDHWHAIPAIMACQAGLDVYVEKPVSRTIAEGRAMVDAARKHKRVMQVGTQQRSGSHFQKAVEIVRSGVLGKITLCRTFNLGNEAPGGIGKPADCPPPAELDWDLWQGPAVERPYNPNRAIYKFRYFWEYANGKITDWGPHLIDIVHWGMGVDAPLTISAAGGKFAVDDNRETYDTLDVTYEYPGFVMTYSYRGACGMPMDGHSYGTQFYGTNGTLFVDRSGFKVFPEGDRMSAMQGGTSEQHRGHVRNFLDCMRSRALPVSDIEIGHRTTSAPLLGVIALKTGRKIRWDGKSEKILNDKEASRLLRPEYRAPWKI